MGILSRRQTSHPVLLLVWILASTIQGLESMDTIRHDVVVPRPTDSFNLPKTPQLEEQQQRPLMGEDSAAKRDSAPHVVPEYTPVVTPPPDQEAALSGLGFKQVTYYSCNTVAEREHCGWHVPIVKAQGVKRDSGTVWIVVGCVAAVFALGLM